MIMSDVASVINTVLVPILGIQVPVIGLSFGVVVMGCVGIIILVKGIKRVV